MSENYDSSHKIRGLDDPEDQLKETIKPKTISNWKEEIKKRIFILSWIGDYNTDDAVGDAIAGITLGNNAVLYNTIQLAIQ